jgi:hypothetical protein
VFGEAVYELWGEDAAEARFRTSSLFSTISTFTSFWADGRFFSAPRKALINVYSHLFNQ